MKEYKKPNIETIELERIELLAESSQRSISKNGKVVIDAEQDYQETTNTWGDAY